MLLNLTINDLAVVKSLNLELQAGMSVLTGETGAGKSILLTALGLALGDRADSTYIRPGCKRAEISLDFDLNRSASAYQWLQDHQLDDATNCLVRRVISSDGRSKAYINDQPVTLQALQNLSTQLVEIHGQHAHLTLLHAEEQRRFLDTAAGNTDLLQQLNNVFKEWQQNRKQLDTLLQAAQDQSAKEELLGFQLEELRQLDLENYDYPALSEEHRLQANLGQILSSGQNQLQILYEDEQHSLIRVLGQSVQSLTELTTLAPELNTMTDMLAEAEIQISEAAQELRRFLESQDLDPQRLQWLDEQLAKIHDLSRKHQVPAAELPAHYLRLQQEYQTLSHSAEHIEQLQQQDQQLVQRYQQLAEQLSAKRQQSAQALQAKISAMIHELGMPHGEFCIRVHTMDDHTPKQNGSDKVEFLVSANPGHPPQALGKVASGGELSRICLAIQVSTSPDKNVSTMIFDEVDSGIGGGIAEIVGKKLKQLSMGRQVMCVTHLPQVAAQANQHLFVSKSNATDATTSSVSYLTAEERLQEIARMLGGVDITENTLAHAQEMIDLGNTAV